jgi:hypothetical protein
MTAPELSLPGPFERDRLLGLELRRAVAPGVTSRLSCDSERRIRRIFPD